MDGENRRHVDRQHTRRDVLHASTAFYHRFYGKGKTFIDQKSKLNPMGIEADCRRRCRIA